MKNNQNDQINRSKVSEKAKQKPVITSSKKESDINSRIIKNNRLDTDVLGMQENMGESPAKGGKHNSKKGKY